MEGFEGPHCEIVGIGFYGNGWALYPPLQSCVDSHLSLELRSNNPDGLVFYVGPTTPDNTLGIQGIHECEIT